MEEPMKGKRFTEEQIIRILQEAESGLAVADVCRKHNCSEQSFYRWKAKFGGMTVSEAKRLKELERENAELKRMVADQALDIRMLKDVNSKKW
jgi:putative transposase